MKDTVTVAIATAITMIFLGVCYAGLCVFVNALL